METNNSSNIYLDKKLYLDILFHVAIIMIYNVLSGYLVNHYTSETLADQNKVPINIISFILGGFLFPLIETAVFQLLPFSILSIMNVDDRRIIFISGLLFGLSHFFSPAYMIVTFFAGSYFSWLFIRYQKKIDIKSAFYIVFIVHSLMNTIVFGLKAYKHFF